MSPEQQWPDTPGSAALGSMFVLGIDGRVYELPSDVASRFQVDAQRMVELGHLPFALPADQQVALGDEVTGRHRVLDLTGHQTFHSDVRYGSYVGRDGGFYVGDHYHPDSNDVGYPA